MLSRTLMLTLPQMPMLTLPLPPILTHRTTDLSAIFLRPFALELLDLGAHVVDGLDRVRPVM